MDIEKDKSQETEELIQCPNCNSTEHVFEREEEVIVITAQREWGRTVIESKFFCGNCKKDF